MKFFLFLEENPSEVRNWTLSSAPKNNDINRDMDSQKYIFFFQELRNNGIEHFGWFRIGIFFLHKKYLFFKDIFLTFGFKHKDYNYILFCGFTFRNFLYAQKCSTEIFWRKVVCIFWENGNYEICSLCVFKK